MTKIVEVVIAVEVVVTNSVRFPSLLECEDVVAGIGEYSGDAVDPRVTVAGLILVWKKSEGRMTGPK